MANSTTTIGSVVGYLRTFPALAAVVQTTAGGASLQPALTIACDVMIEMISQAFNWKWNRFLLPLFYTNSYQQDYALNVINLGWLEHGFCIDINNTSNPLPKWPLETVKDLESSSQQYGRPGQVCWLPNDQLFYATWGVANPGGAVGPNPQANGVITNPLGVTAQPNNPFNQVRDPNGNLWAITTYGTFGATAPVWPANPVFPTSSAPTTVATTIAENSPGTAVWTAINPKGQGIRINPIPPQSGVVFQINIVGQWRAFAFSNGPYINFNQTIEPIPDDFAKWFRDGFVAFTYEHSSETKLQALGVEARRKWMESLMQSRVQGDRERDNSGFYPATSIIDTPWVVYPGPAYPFNLPF